MARRSSLDTDPVLGRQRTADLLRRLREASKELRMLKARIRHLERSDREARAARLVSERRRRSK